MESLLTSMIVSLWKRARSLLGCHVANKSSSSTGPRGSSWKVVDAKLKRTRLPLEEDWSVSSSLTRWISLQERSKRTSLLSCFRSDERVRSRKLSVTLLERSSSVHVRELEHVFLENCSQRSLRLRRFFILLWTAFMGFIMVMVGNAILLGSSLFNNLWGKVSETIITCFGLAADLQREMRIDLFCNRSQSCIHEEQCCFFQVRIVLKESPVSLELNVTSEQPYS